MAAPKRWIMEVRDVPDGSGDGVLQFPDDLWSELLSQGWQVGDVLELDLTTAPGVARVRNRYAECRQISVPGKSFSNDPEKS